MIQFTHNNSKYFKVKSIFSQIYIIIKRSYIEIKITMKSTQLSGPVKTIRDYVYSSQTKNRDQYTLKNILELDADYQKNFISQNSQRLTKTAPRPHTMYGDRLRIKLIDENRNTKMHSQAKINRYSSGKLIRNNTAQQKKVTQQQKMKMKKAVGKISLLAQGYSTNNMNSQQQLNTIFNFMQCLNRIDNHYKDNFTYVTNRLRKFIYLNHQDTQLRQKVKKLTQICKNQQLINFLYRPTTKITYQTICQQFFKIFMTLHQQMQVLKESSKNIKATTQKSLIQKQQMIVKLKRQLKYYSEHPSQDLYPYIRKIQKQNKQNTLQIEQLTQQADDRQYRIQILQNTNLLLSQQIQSLKTKIYQFELAQLSGANEIQKSSELRDFQINIQKLRDMLQKSQLKMEGMKQQYDQVKQYNQKLLNQRSILAKRAAVGYGQLTPRPKLQQMFINNKLDYQKYFHAKQSYSTQQAVQILVQNMKLIPKQEIKPKKKKKIDYHQLNQQPDFIDNDINNQFPTQVMNHIQETKQQINITKQAAERVRQEYNRQLKERQALEKNRVKK